MTIAVGERTIYLRFFGSMKELSKERAKYLATVDGVDHVALVALDPEDSHEIVAIVRYDREPEDEKAEYAAVRASGISLSRKRRGVRT
jgi:hypothetical protein